MRAGPCPTLQNFIGTVCIEINKNQLSKTHAECVLNIIDKIDVPHSGVADFKELGRTIPALLTNLESELFSHRDDFLDEEYATDFHDKMIVFMCYTGNKNLTAEDTRRIGAAVINVHEAIEQIGTVIAKRPERAHIVQRSGASPAEGLGNALGVFIMMLSALKPPSTENFFNKTIATINTKRKTIN